MPEGPVRQALAMLAVHEEANLHQACAANDHDEAERIIKLKMSGDIGAFKELKKLLLHPNDNKQAWPRDASDLHETLTLTPAPTRLSMP